jgi:hypothetical protein
MGELFYTEFGLQAGGTILHPPGGSAATMFRNFQPYYYWSGSEVLEETSLFPPEFQLKPDTHETFSFGSGYRSGNVDPNEMYVIPVFDGTVHTVTSNSDSGKGSLRAAVAAAAPGDTIEFSPGLDGYTISLQSTIDINKPLYIVGPGASKLTISSANEINLFYVGPDARASTGQTTSIYGLKLESVTPKFPILEAGLVTLKSDVFKQNAGPPGRRPGGIPNPPPGGGQPI